MLPEHKKPLDLAPLEADRQKKPETLPPHERFGAGRRYRFGSTIADIYPDPPGELQPVVLFRLRRGSLTFGDIQTVEPGQNGGMKVLHLDGGIEVSKTGDIAMVYLAPAHEPPPMLISESGHVRRDARGTEYTQHEIVGENDVEKAEFKRIEVIIGSVPVGVTKQRGAPLRFTVYEKLDPSDPTQEKEWEVKAYNKWVAKLRDLELKPGDKVFLIGAWKHWTAPKAGGGDIDYECLNVVNLHVVERKQGKAKRAKPARTPQL